MIDRMVHHADVIAPKDRLRIKHTAIESLPFVEADRKADSTPQHTCSLFSWQAAQSSTGTDEHQQAPPPTRSPS
jgi:hypothetical protein